jgi:dTMP kinase
MTKAQRHFITFEGVEGSGKSTLQRRLAEALTACGHAVLCVREPGGTAVGERIRDVVLDAAEHGRVEAWTELFLMLAARAQIVRERIVPALESDQIVLCDRYMDASVAYQGGGRGLGAEVVQRLNRLATGELPPDLTFLVDLDPELGQRRLQHPPDRMEKEDLSFHEAVRRTYLQLAAAEPDRFCVLDGRLSPAELADAAWSVMVQRDPELPRILP